ncbi:MAG TPA: ATP-dependent RecD-like DNA helicase, partial [Polyangiaceae bacterium]|nr:ATP-dependent RecD-like DNA helicase [Polyangiaceae bacterium]
MNVTLLGEVERVTFENEATSFRVLRLREVQGLGEQRRVTVVGTVPSVGEGTRVRVDGRLEVDPKHGERVRADSLVVVVPENLGELEKYLGSGVVSGLGPGFAKRIVKYFGLETLRVLDFDGHRLIEVTGLGPAKVKEIRAGWLEHRSLSNIMLALAAFGVSSGLAQRILQRFGERAQAVIQESPYRLAIEVPGVGFKTADRIARARGLAADHPERLQAGLLHELREASDSGHCRVEQTLLLERSANALGVDAALLPAALDGVATDGWVVVEADGVYLTKLHEAEVRVARELKRLLAAPSHSLPELESSLAAFEASASIQLAEAQRAAVMAAAEQKFVLITGGPGVGKTTIVRAILSVLERRSLRVRLAAPTGRAAKRLTESTGVQA